MVIFHDAITNRSAFKLKDMSEAIRSSVKIINQNLINGSTTTAINTEPENTNTPLTMTRDQGQKPMHNDTGLQADDQRANGPDTNVNNNINEVIIFF